MNLDSESTWLNANQNQRNRPQGASREAKIDKAISEIVGRPVMAKDPILLALLVEWKNKVAPEVEMIKYTKAGEEKEMAVEKPVNILGNEGFIKALKEKYV